MGVCEPRTISWLQLDETLYLPKTDPRAVTAGNLNSSATSTIGDIAFLSDDGVCAFNGSWRELLVLAKKSVKSMIS